MFLVLLAFRLNLINCLLEKNFEFSLGCQLFVVLESGAFEKSTLVLHHLAKLFHNTVVSAQFLLFGLYLARRHVDEWTTLLIRSSPA